MKAFVVDSYGENGLKSAQIPIPAPGAHEVLVEVRAAGLGVHVTTTVRGNDTDKVRALGADEVIDFTTTDFAEVGGSYNVVLDSLGGTNLEKSLTVLKPDGLAISFVGPPDPAFATQIGRPLLRPVLAALSREVRKRAKDMVVRYSFFFMRADGGQLKELARLYDGGVLRPVLDRSFAFDQTLEAMAYVELGHANGKVVVVP